MTTAIAEAAASAALPAAPSPPAASMHWHTLSLSGRLSAVASSSVAAAAAVDLTHAVLLLPPRLLHAHQLRVGEYVWIRSSASSLAPARVHVLSGALCSQVHWLAAPGVEDAVAASDTLWRQCGETKPGAGPIQLQFSTPSFGTSSLPAVRHVVLRRMGSSPPSPAIGSFDILASFLPAVLRGAVLAKGSLVQVVLHETEWFEVAELLCSSTSSASAAATTSPADCDPALPAPPAAVFAAHSVVSMAPQMVERPTPAQLLPSFPSSPERWLRRLSTRVYGFSSLLTALVDSMWHAVDAWRQEADAVTAGRAHSSLSAYAPKTFLLHGLSGAGKTHLCRALAAASGLPHFFLPASAALHATEGQSETQLVALFQQARDTGRPSVIVLDEVDTILPKSRDGAASDAAAAELAEMDGDAGAKQIARDWTLGNARIEWRLAAMLKELLDEVNGAAGAMSTVLPQQAPPPSPPPVFVFFTTSNISALDTAGLRMSPYIDEEHELRALSFPERVQALSMGMARMKFEEELEQRADAPTSPRPIPRTNILARLAAELHGFVPADIDGFIRETLLRALKRTQEEKAAAAADSTSQQQLLRLDAADVLIKAEDYQHVLSWFRPANLQALEFRLPKPPSAVGGEGNETVAVSSPVPSGSEDEDEPLPFSSLAHHFRSLSGITPLLQHLHYSFLLPIKQPALYARWQARLGMSASRGVLIYGPSGVGKTALALCLARACGLNAMVVPATALVSKVLGSSERSLASLFAKARASAPALLVFDQIEMLAPVRRGLVQGGEGQGDAHASDWSERLLSVLLIELDGVLGSTQADVRVVATTSRPDLVDPALLRPARLDAHVYLPPPTQAQRAEILQASFAATPLCVDVDAQGRMLLPRAHSLAVGMLDADTQARVALCDWEHSPEVSSSAQPAVASSAELKQSFLRVLSHLTVDFSPADLVSLQREAAMHALRHDLSSTCVRSWRDLLLGTLRTMSGSLHQVPELHPFARGVQWAAGFGAGDATRAMFTKKTAEEIAAKSVVSVTSFDSATPAPSFPPSAANSNSTAPAPFVFDATAWPSSSTSASSSSSSQPPVAAFSFDSAPAAFSIGTKVDRVGEPPATSRDGKRRAMKDQ